MLLCIICHKLAAQQYPVRVQVQTLQPVSAQLSNLYNGSQARMIITLLNTDLRKPTLNVRLRLNIKGTTVALRNRDYGSYPLVQLDAGVPVQLSLNDLAPYFNLDNLEVSGMAPTLLVQNGGKLPDGFYTFCVDVVEATSGQLISNGKQSCAPPVFISTSEPPLLNLPRKGESVAFREPLNIVFNWTPRHMGSPNAAFQTEYEFTLVELWDNNILPEAAFGTMPPLYQTTTNSTTLLYGPAQPPMLPGKRYGWRIRAIAKQGLDIFDVFTNNGYSEIYYFNLQDDCQPPQQVAATVANGEAAITWAPQPKMFEYLVEYREQGNDNAEWFNVKSNNDPKAVIKDAIPGHKYEYRVGGSCSLNSKTLGDVHAFEMPAKDAVDSGNCGLLSNIKLANDTVLKTLKPDDQIMAGDFPVRFTTLKGSGTYSGTGYITIPFLGYNRVKVKFDNIQVNTSRQLMKGMLMTTFDSTKLQGTNVDTIVQVISDMASVINDLIHLTLDADYVKVQQMAEAIKKAAEEELPEELKTRMNQAANNLVQAKEEYDAAKKELADAKTPEEKAAAEQKVKDAEKKFDDAKKEVEAVNKEKEELVNDVAGIIVKAIKELKEDAKGWDKSADLSTQQAAMKQALYDKQGLEETADAGVGVAIGDVQQLTLSDAEISDEMKQFDEVVEQFHLTNANVKAYRLVSAIQKFYETPAAIAQFLSQDKALKGTSMLKTVMTDKMQGKTDEELIKVVKQSILDQLIIILNSDQLTK
jgi:hypothetical protein